MKLATFEGGGPDGRLAVVSSDLSRAVFAAAVAPTLQAALESWDAAASRLAELHRALERDEAGDSFAFDQARVLAPLPRAWQWLDGSAYPSHGALMDKAYGGVPPPPDRPLMYQGMSHTFLAPSQDVALPDEADGIDFEGEFGIITDRVPLGTPARSAGRHIKLLVQINDWSLRVAGVAEMRTGFGWVQGKPACSVAPVAVTPDELGDEWRDARAHLTLNVDWNGTPFGAANGGAMAFGFDELVAHAARTRDLCAGTVIGSGTVSNENFREVGSSCIAERRGIEIVDHGTPSTPFMRFGDRIRMQATRSDGASVFGAIDQRVVAARRTG